MSISLLNRIYKGCLFIWENENFLVNSILEVDDEDNSVKTHIANAEGELILLFCTVDEFLESVVK